MTTTAESFESIRGRIRRVRSTTEADSIHDVIDFHVDELDMHIDEVIKEAEDMLLCVKALANRPIVRSQV